MPKGGKTKKAGKSKQTVKVEVTRVSEAQAKKIQDAMGSLAADAAAHDGGRPVRRHSGIVHHGPLVGWVPENIVGQEVFVSPSGEVSTMDRGLGPGFRGILLKIKGDTGVVQLAPANDYLSRMTVGNVHDMLSKILGR
jgi:hypothetical protein